MARYPHSTTKLGLVCMYVRMYTTPALWYDVVVGGALLYRGSQTVAPGQETIDYLWQSALAQTI